MADIKSMILKKHENKAGKKLVLRDVNRGLITALLAIPIYGKDARDEEILSVIINAGASPSDRLLANMKKRYDEMVKNKQLKKTKAGVRDLDGFIVLVPKR